MRTRRKEAESNFREIRNRHGPLRKKLQENEIIVDRFRNMEKVGMGDRGGGGSILFSSLLLPDIPPFLSLRSKVRDCLYCSIRSRRSRVTWTHSLTVLRRPEKNLTAASERSNIASRASNDSKQRFRLAAIGTAVGYP